MPRDDSTDVVTHARFTVFLMLLVSAIVFGSILLDKSDQLQRAHNEMELVTGLMGVWDQSREQTNSHSLATIVGGPADPDRDLYETYDLHAILVDKSAENPPTQIQCTTALNLNQYFVIPDGLGPDRYRFQTAPIIAMDPPPISPLWHALVPDTRSRPRNLAGFAHVWNYLVDSRKAARITAVKPDLAYLSTRHGVYQIQHAKLGSTPKAERYQYNLTLIVPANDDVVASTDNDLGYSERSLLHPKPIPNEWLQADVRGVVKASCRGQTVGKSFPLYRVFIPAEWRTVEFSGTRIWQQRALEGGFLPSGMYGSALKFNDAFPFLHRQAKGLESLNLNDLQTWLMNRLNEGGENIQIIGLSIPHNPLRNIGVILIVVFQLYAMLHMSQAAQRLSAAGRGDSGAFVPWIILYRSWLSCIVSHGLVAAPTIVVVVVLVVLFLNQQAISVWGAITALNFVFSVGLAWNSTKLCIELRNQSYRHSRLSENAHVEKNPSNGGG